MEEAALRKLISATLGLAFLAAFSLANTGNAETILIFGQPGGTTDVITERVANGVTTLTTGSGPTASFIPVTITNLGGITPQGGSISAFESFTLTSPTAPGAGATSLDNFSGNIQFSQTPGGVSILTVNLTNGLLTQTGNAATFSSGNSTFTNLNPAIVAQIGGTTGFGGTSLAFSNVVGSIPTGFTAQNAGNFATAVPEPISLVSGSIAFLTGVGFFGVRRFRAAQNKRQG